MQQLKVSLLKIKYTIFVHKIIDVLDRECNLVEKLLSSECKPGISVLNTNVLKSKGVDLLTGPLKCSRAFYFLLVELSNKIARLHRKLSRTSFVFPFE